MSSVTSFLHSLVQFPEKILGLLPIISDGQKQLVAGMVGEACGYINSELQGMKPVEILCITVLGLVLARCLWTFLWLIYRNMTRSSIEVALFRFAARFVPQVRSQIEGERAKMAEGVVKKFTEARRATAIPSLPAEGWKDDRILARVQEKANVSAKLYRDGGNLTGAVYTKDEAHWDFVCASMRASIVSNPLHIGEFLYATQMEAEILRWTLDLYSGTGEACGIVTSGGTESILLAILAYREKAKAERGITQPNIVLSETAHCAFDKAGHYFDVEVRKVPMKKDFTCDVNAIKWAMDSNTICLVASAPEFAFGNYEPVAEIAAIASAAGIGCHSDCCLGSYVNPFIKELGYELPYEFDFRVPGVTSISVDPHKYAYGPKGCSILLFRDHKLRNYQFFSNTVWNGGIYATTCMAGSRPGAVIVGTHSSMLRHGRNGLKEKARKILHAQQSIAKALTADKDVQIVTHNPGPVVALTSQVINAIALGDVMLKQSQWTVSLLQRPAGIHLALTAANCDSWEHFVKSVKKGVQAMKIDPSLNVNHDTAMYGLSGSIPDKTLLNDFVFIHQAMMLDCCPKPEEKEKAS